MLSQSRGLRLALVLLMSFGYVAWDGHRQVAYAEDDEDDGDDGGDDGGGGDEPDEPDEPEEDEDQPPVTAGGLYTMKTFPIRELDRPLTITQGIAQVRIGVGADVSAKGAFETFGAALEARYGFRDNVMGLGGFTGAYNFKQFGVYAGVEAALAYDLIDFRGAFRVSRPAVPDTMDNGMGMQVPVPGEYTTGNVSAGIDIGFPFRYVAKPEIAIVALDTLMSIDFDSKPDLKPSLGISTNPIAPLSVVIFAQLQIIDFDTDAGFVVPATARVQFSPSRKMDLGAEFTFLNVKQEKFHENRFLTLYVQGRFGK